MSNKLHISRLEDAGADGWHMRFSCEEKADFDEMVEQLKWEGCHWERTAFNGRGAWIVEHSVLLLLKERFDNVEACIERVKQRQKLQQAAQARELAGKQRDINEVPF